MPSQSEALRTPIDTLKKSAVARYIQLATLFRRRIETGDWPVGDQISTVEVLSKEFGVATMTIRQALNVLEEEGLIERFRAKGTFVRQRPRRDLWCDVQTDWSGMLIARDGAAIEVISDTQNVDLPVRQSEIGNAGESYRHLRRRHTRDGEAYYFADIYLSERIVALVTEDSFAKKAAMSLVAEVDGLKITDATQTLTIDTADMELAEMINVPLGHPIAKVERCAVDETGEIVLLANGIYRGDRVRIDFKLR